MNDIDPQEVNEALGSLPEAPLSIHIDAYYKGFHSGITIRMTDNSVIPVHKVRTVIENLLASGFEPSWNTETNGAHKKTQHDPEDESAFLNTPSEQKPDLGVCPKCGAPNKLSAKGNVYCGNRCWLKG